MERNTVLDKNYLIMLFSLSEPFSDMVHAIAHYIQDHWKQKVRGKEKGQSIL